MSRSMSMRSRRDLPPPQQTIEKLENMVDGGNYYEAQQMYKSTTARYIASQRYSEALDILQSGALIQLKHGQKLLANLDKLLSADRSCHCSLCNVAGFIHVTDVDIQRKKLTYIAPCPGDLPSRLLIASSLTWYEA